MQKIISSRDAFYHSRDLRLSIEVFSSAGASLGNTFTKANPDLTLQLIGENIIAISHTEEGESYLSKCPIEW